MELSNTAILVLGALALAAVFAALIYIIAGRRRQKGASGEAPYRWKPEQDYDVVLHGETPMTPGFPTLRKRPPRTRPGKTQEPSG